MKRKTNVFLIILFALSVFCMTHRDVIFSRNKTPKYTIVSARILKRDNLVKISENGGGASATSPCSFTFGPIQHKCEMKEHGDTSVSFRVESSPRQIVIESRMKVIQSKDDISGNLKLRILEHLGVKTGTFYSHDLYVSSGQKEFDDKSFIAEGVLVVAATVEEYEIVYTSSDDGREKKVTVSIYKDVAPFCDFRLSPLSTEQIAIQ